MVESFRDQLGEYDRQWERFNSRLSPEERESQRTLPERFVELLGHGPGAFVRDHLPGHFTGSALVVTPSFDRILLTLHRKLGKWLQLGGHADGDVQLARVALREAEEESGLARLEVPGEPPRILDLDLHWIPEGKEPGHSHYDVRYLVVAPIPEPLQLSEESTDLRWFSLTEARALSAERSLLRLFDKLAWLKASAA